MSSNRNFDIAIIGGGFYGCMIALFLARFNKKIILLEKEDDLLKRASYNNQARVHNGYHYPRSFLTALRSHINSLKFSKDFKKAICDNFTMIYAIASTFSKTTSLQFKKFCQQIGSPIYPLPPSLRKMFDQHLIEDAFLVKEHIFDVGILKNLIRNLLIEKGVKIKYNSSVYQIKQTSQNNLACILTSGQTIIAKTVFNCTYSQINAILKNSNLPTLSLKHEFCEMPLITPPKQLQNLGITIMDGSFFGVLPFPDRKLHTIHHVRYSPRLSWIDEGQSQINTDKLNLKSKYPFMIKDAQRYIPLLEESQYQDSLYEVRTILPEMEDSDGRPILFRGNHGLKNLHIVLGGKLDNVYDVIKKLKDYKSQEQF